MSKRTKSNGGFEFLMGDKTELIVRSQLSHDETIDPWPSLRARGLQQNPFTGLYESTAFQMWEKIPEEPLLRAWFRLIPQHVRDIIQRYKAGHYQIARLCSLGETQTQLAKENRGVAMALAIELDQTHDPKESTADIYEGVSWGRRDLLRRTGFEPRPAVWRTLARMTSASATPQGIASMQGLLDDWALRRLGYVRQITPDVIALLGSKLPRTVKTVQLLQAAAETGEHPWSDDTQHGYYASVTGAAHHLLAMGLHMPKRDLGWTKLRSLESLAKAADSMRIRTRRHEVASWQFDRPLMERPDIRFISTGAELWREGEQMRNCVSGFADECLAGKMAAYQVLSPERCTVLLSLDSDDKWRIEDVRAYDNSKASDAVLSSIQSWLAIEQCQYDWPMRRFE